MSRVTRFFHRPAATAVADTDFFWFDSPNGAEPQKIAWSTLRAAISAALSQGAGLSGTGTVVKTAVEKVGDLFKTTIFVDLTGLQSSTTDLDIIGAMSADMVTNGAFGADTDWTYTAFWAIAAGVATASAGGGVLEPTVPLTVIAGETYEVTYTMSGFTAGTCTVSIGGTDGTARGSDATFTERLVATDTSNLKFTADVDGDFSIDDVSVKLVSAAYLCQITAAVNGTIVAGKVTCIEAPADGIDDIDLYSATVGTGKFDDGIAALVETALLTSGAAWTAAVATPVSLSALPPANGYLYFTCGDAGTVGTYTAGQFIIELLGV